MESKQTYTEKEVIGITINQLNSASLPGSVIGALAPDQIMAIKQQLLDPMENARRNLIQLYQAHDAAEKQAAAQAAAAGGDGDEIQVSTPVPVAEEDIPEDAEIIEIAPAE